MQSAPPRLAAWAAAPISARSRTSRKVSVPTITRAAPWETARRAASAVATPASSQTDSPRAAIAWTTAP